MKITKIWSALLLITLVSCLDPEPIKQKKSGGAAPAEVARVDAGESSGIAAKNFAQINNTYATLTGISAGDVSGEYDSIKMQLPSTSNPNSLNGFNQIASTRLAFAYCNNFIDNRTDLPGMSDDGAIQNMIDGFVDMDSKNSDHQAMKSELLTILKDGDGLVNDGNSGRKRVKMLKLSCTALLSSSYVTLI